jgi:kynurenine formamidase
MIRRMGAHGALHIKPGDRPMSAHPLSTLLQALKDSHIHVVDLTQTLTPDFPTITLPAPFAQCAPFQQEAISRYDERGPHWYWNNFTCSEHTGTHFDAPIHWVTGKDLPNNAVDTIAPERFLAPAVVIDCSREAAADPDFVLSADFIRTWEARHGAIEPGNWVLMRTDWSKRPREQYVNVREDGAHTPGPAPEAIQLLIERDVLGFGTETIGTDAGQAHRFDPPLPAHSLMHGSGRYGLQCLTNLDRLPAKGTLIIAAPLKLQNGSGSPLRVLALVSSRP